MRSRLACFIVIGVLLFTSFGYLFQTHGVPVTSLLRAGVSSPSKASNDLDFSLNLATAEQLSQHLKSGALTSTSLVQAYIDRAIEINKQLHAISEINPDALDIAQRLDDERAAGHVRGPLHGIPILIKDNIATLDDLNTTAGSYALLGARVVSESPVVTALRHAGAIVLGKSTMGEWAQYRSTRAGSSAGWSAYGRQPLGTYYPNQDPHGSSSGSAVAISAGLAPLSLGTETSGSIVNPAERNNLVGIKPTLGLVSRHMVIPISVRQDSVGPIAKTVLDAATVLSVIAGPDSNDNFTSAQPAVLPDYIGACDPLGLKGARIGVPRNLIRRHLEPRYRPVMEAFEHALRDVVRGGASLIDNANLREYNPHAFHKNEGVVLESDFAVGIKQYFDKLIHNPHGIHSLHDLRNFTWGHEHESWPYRDTDVWDRDLMNPIAPDSAQSFMAYEENLKMGMELGIDGALDDFDLDALVIPTFAAFQLPAVAGLPVITVPLGFFPDNVEVHRNPKGTMFTVAPGIPFGISFVGRKWSEETLIRLAYAFEQRTQVQSSRMPMILPQTDLTLSKVVESDEELGPQRDSFSRDSQEAGTTISHTTSSVVASVFLPSISDTPRTRDFVLQPNHQKPVQHLHVAGQPLQAVLAVS